ncbi:Bacterial type II secretion system protein F domain protein [Polystyrenella longa]|uniref:Bacterial type II secretion system protein F domain protein n=1 Tax=Polystyrenella longa TaxID=2528007 RepID=A0A518CS85_9PLAN|nr:type II secretion system F family protein [Polystyrenella longa]QDU82082.1 Bacterial type II secretion system protein F domain protein [Polystyrenella longa]
MALLLISLAVFVGVVCVVVAISFVMGDIKDGSKTEERLRSLTGRLDEDEQGSITKEAINDSLTGIRGSFKKLGRRFTGLSLLLEQADAPIRTDMFIPISLACGALGVFVAIVAQSPPPLYPVAALGFGILPLMWIMMRRRKRFKKFAQQLPDALELVARALRSGHSLASGLHVVIEEMPSPISTEFGKSYEEQNLGVSMEDALKNMLKRMPNLDLKFFVTAVAIQRTAGGDMAEILDKIGYIIRERFKILGQVQALTGEGRISGVVLMGLPVALFVAVYYLNPDYVMLLFTDENGRKMIAGAAFLQLLGAVAIKKIVNIKV